MEFGRALQFGRPALVDSEGNVYGLREDGFINFGDVALNLLGQQCQYASRYIDPSFHNHPEESRRKPNLAVGLRVDTDSTGGNYHEFGIHPDDVDEFVARYNAYQSYRTGRRLDENGKLQEIDEPERQRLESYLREVGAIS